MNIDDILLTDSEIEDEVAGDAWLDDMSWVCKAQCLKLLEWLRGRCPHTMRIGDMERWERFSCPKCMAGLEAVLKEG